MMSITISLYDIQVAWDASTFDILGRLSNAIARPPLIGASPQEFGFVDVFVWNTRAIYGHFVQHFERDIIEYDENKV